MNNGLKESMSGTHVKLPHHFKPSSKDDEFETPDILFTRLTVQHNIYPSLDVAATKENSKCSIFFDKKDNALDKDWLDASWMNHPHTLHAEFAEKAYLEWKHRGITILAIFPANCMRTDYWHKFIEGHAKYYAIHGAITFLQDGKPSEFSSRNAYVSVVWRGKKS